MHCTLHMQFTMSKTRHGNGKHGNLKTFFLHWTLNKKFKLHSQKTICLPSESLFVFQRNPQSVSLEECQNELQNARWAGNSSRNNSEHSTLLAIHFTPTILQALQAQLATTIVSSIKTFPRRFQCPYSSTVSSVAPVFWCLKKSISFNPTKRVTFAFFRHI